MNHNLFELKEGYSQAYIDNTEWKPVTTRVNHSLNVVRTHSSPLAKVHNMVLKRALDICISLLATVFLLSWLLPVLAVLIKLDSAGPVFFVQKRNKKNGRFFYCLKLRTMVVNKDADTLTAVVNDKRITALGRFLRISHLDELPQLLNVLIGDMSVIGPRPHMFAENVKYTSMYSSYSERNAVKPGITGLAQSLGYHGPITERYQLEKKIEYDISYINSWSLKMDAKILARTLVVIYKKFI